MQNFKIQIAIIAAVGVGALAMVFVQQQTIKELRKDNADLKQQVAQIAPLQDQLAAATQNAAGGASVQAEQTRELARLRNEVARLHGQTNELAKAKQQIQTLNERVVSEAEAKRNAVAAAQAADQKSQEAQAAAQKTSNANACINYLRIIDAAKQQWALENKKQNTDTPTMDDLKPYFGANVPVCPDGGTYTIGAVSEKPTCSVAGHALP